MTEQYFKKLKPGDIVHLKKDVDLSIHQKYKDWEITNIYEDADYVMAENDYCNPTILYFNELV